MRHRVQSGADACVRNTKSRQRASQHVVRAVAERLIVGGLAAAQIEYATSVGHEAQWLQARILVGAVAERLLRRATAPAIEVGLSFLEVDLIGTFLGDYWIVSHLPLRDVQLAGS